MVARWRQHAGLVLPEEHTNWLQRSDTFARDTLHIRSTHLEALELEAAKDEAQARALRTHKDLPLAVAHVAKSPPTPSACEGTLRVLLAVLPYRLAIVHVGNVLMTTSFLPPSRLPHTVRHVQLTVPRHSHRFALRLHTTLPHHAEYPHAGTLGNEVIHFHPLHKHCCVCCYAGVGCHCRYPPFEHDDGVVTTYSRDHMCDALVVLYLSTFELVSEESFGTPV